MLHAVDLDLWPGPSGIVGENGAGGEARKILLSRALLGRAWACLLDEPTNHLDLPSAERLAAALAAWPGSLVVVSHDRRFARAAGLTTSWTCADGRVRVESLAEEDEHRSIVRGP